MIHRYYRISIQLGPYRFVSNSKIHEIEDGKSTILPGLGYTAVTLLLGWWGFRWARAIQESTEAIGINFSGGEDISKLMSEQDYDEDTNYIWNNLLRSTKEIITKKDLEIALSLQYEFMEQHASAVYSESNVEYLLAGLKTLQVQHVDPEIIADLFEALQLYHSAEDRDVD